MHVSPLLDLDPVMDAQPRAKGVHKAVLARGLIAMTVFACMMLLALAPRFFHEPSVAATIAEYAAWNAADHAPAR